MITTIQNNLLILADAPQIPGLTFRNFRGQEDFAEMAGIIHGCKQVDQIERSDSAEDVARLYAHLANCDPYQDVFLTEVAGLVIGYGMSRWFREQDGKLIYSHKNYLLPAWRGKGIRRAMLRYNEAHLRAIAVRNSNGTGKFFESFVADTEVAMTALLVGEGYTPIRHFYNMVRPDLEDIPEAPMPEGLEVRPVKLEHVEAICDASKEAFRDHWGYSEDIEPTVQEWLDDPLTDLSLWRVAWDGDQVAGMVLSYIDSNENAEYNRMRGWTENICVRRPWRRKGLARALIVRALEAVKERGMSEAALGVDTDNTSGALRLYESVGFRPVKRFSAYQKSLDV
jgi:GNAT superfamily N-acetyltransferase